jgi:hypothetical protein
MGAIFMASHQLDPHLAADHYLDILNEGAEPL